MSGLQFFNEMLFVAVFLILAVSMIIMTAVALLRYHLETGTAVMLTRRVDALQTQVEQLLAESWVHS